MPEYLNAFSGGLLIGLAAVILLLATGNIAGISGIYWNAISKRLDAHWQWLFVLGLVLGGMVFALVSGQTLTVSEKSIYWAAAAGLLVGFGTRLGSGCTSGHGVCGIARFSVRSLVATCVFMLFGILTVAAMGHLL